jgi:hypothetical protein
LIPKPNNSRWNGTTKHEAKFHKCATSRVNHGYVFWNEKGFILVKFLPRAPAVNSDHYAEILKPVTAVTGPMIIEKATSFYDEMKVCAKCTFSESWLHKITCKNLHQYRYLLII